MTSSLSQGRRRRRDRLKRLIYPRHIAVFGGQSATDCIRGIRRTGFAGPIWPVNPKEREIAGLDVTPRMADLPEPPDAAFLYVSRNLTIPIIRELSEAGAGGAVCLASGFAELDDEGARLQDDLVQAAADMPFLGPNGLGLLNFLDEAAVWPLAEINAQKRDKGVVLITQSGSVGINYALNQRDLPVAAIFSLGNQAQCDAADIMAVMSQDERVSGFALYLEGLGDLAAFCDAAGEAFARGLPVICVKVGRSELGGQAVESHTASERVDDGCVQALFDRAGVVRLDTLTELDEAIKLMGCHRRVKGDRLAYLTNSGGYKGLGADHASALNITLPQPGPEVAEALRQQIPSYATVSNPLDYNAASYAAGTGGQAGILWMGDQAMLARCFSTMLEDRYDAAVIVNDYPMTPDGPTPVDETLRAWVDATRDKEYLVAAMSVWPESLPEEHRVFLMENDVAPLQGVTDGMRALKAMIERERLAALLRQNGGVRALALAGQAADGPGRTMSGADAAAFLASHGLSCGLPGAGSADVTNWRFRVSRDASFGQVLRVGLNGGAARFEREALAVLLPCAGRFVEGRLSDRLAENGWGPEARGPVAGFAAELSDTVASIGGGLRVAELIYAVDASGAGNLTFLDLDITGA